MPEAVVDELEVVQVDIQHSHPGAGALGAGQRQLQVLLEQDAVGQPGQRVVVRQAGQLLLGLAAVGDVLADPGAAGDRAVAVAQRGRVPGEEPRLAGAGEDRALAVGDHAPLGQLGQECALAVAAFAGDERLDPRPAEQLVVPPAGELGEVLVDEHDATLEVGRDRGQADVLQQLAEPLLGLQQLRLVLLVVGHLEDHALHEAGGAGRVAHGRGVVAEPADAAVHVDQSVLGRVRIPGLDGIAIAVGREQVVRVHPLDPAVRAARPLLGGHAHQRLQLGADVHRVAGACHIHVGDGGQVLDQAAVAVLGLPLLLVQQSGVDGGADDVGQRAEELQVVLVPHPVGDVDDLQQPDRVAARDQRQHQQRAIATLLEQRPLRRIGVLVGDADDHRLLPGHHRHRGGEVGQRILHVGLGDLADHVVLVVGQRDQQVALPIPHRDGGAGRPGERDRVCREAAQDVLQVEAGGEGPREVDEGAQTVGREHGVRIGTRRPIIEDGSRRVLID